VVLVLHIISFVEKKFVVSEPVFVPEGMDSVKIEEIQSVTMLGS